MTADKKEPGKRRGEWKKRRQTSRGVKEKLLEGLRDGEREMKKVRKKSIKAEEKKRERDSESSFIVGERVRWWWWGDVSPMAATHHSQLNDAIFFFLFPLLFCGRGWRGREFRPAPNLTGSYKVHNRPGGPVLLQGTVCM